MNQRISLAVELTIDPDAYSDDAGKVPEAVAREVQEILRRDESYPCCRLTVKPTSAESVQPKIKKAKK